MKILLINNFHYRKGGSEAVYFNMARMLVRHGHEVLFFSCTDSRNEPCGQSGYFIKPNASLPKIEGAIRYFYNREAKRNLERLIAEERPDIAHVHLFWGGISPSIFGVLHKHRIPLVHTAHDYRMICPAYTFRTPDGRICEQCRGRHFYRCTLNRCAKGSVAKSLLMSAEMYLRNAFFNPVRNIDGFVFVSRFAHEKHLEYMPAFGGAKYIVAYNSIPSLDERFVSSKRGGYFLFFGRLSHEKGVATLIDAFLAKPDAQLKIVGTGPEEAALKARVGQAQAHNIEFLGYRNGDALKETIRDAAFVVVPSEWYENNPMTIVEAYSAGVPVIGARIGGIPEIVDEGKTGFLFDSGNADDLGGRIDEAQALNNAEYAAMSRNAKAFADTHFDEDKNYEKIIGLYRTILQEYEK
ncbi:MAG: glycosyltransferase [Alistipes sp.]